MATPLHIPRVNNNDDNVRIVEIGVKEGDFIKSGQIVGVVETDKSLLDVEAERDGFVIKILSRPGTTASVGSVLLWLGDAIDEAAPEPMPIRAHALVGGNRAHPTAKARAMLRELDIDPAQIPAIGERLTVADVEAWLTKRQQPKLGIVPARPIAMELTPSVPGEYGELSSEEHGMLTTVLWHRDRAVHGYLEVEYDPKPWDHHAALYAKRNKLMLSPLLPLLAFRLVKLAKAKPHINATIVNDRRYQYRAVNLGFTVQAGPTLYLTVVQDAHDMDPPRFIEAMGQIQRRALARKLRAAETSGATIAFSSMARWNVSRHIPVLPPYTCLMIAHAAPRGSGRAVLGASYDHRLLSGFDAVQVLQALTQPPQSPEMEEE